MFFNRQNQYNIVRTIIKRLITSNQETASHRLMIKYEVELSKAREVALLSDNALKAKTLEQKEQEVFSQKLIIVLGAFLLLIVASVLLRERYIRHKLHSQDS